MVAIGSMDRELTDLENKEALCNLFGRVDHLENAPKFAQAEKGEEQPHPFSVGQYDWSFFVRFLRVLSCIVAGIGCFRLLSLGFELTAGQVWPGILIFGAGVVGYYILSDER
jgi:hypothetical protein